MDVKDSNGAILEDGDSVQVIKDLKIKGASDTLKRGTVIKNIKLTSKAEEIECRIGKSTIVLKTCFMKKV
jgi:protein PhnA